MAVDLHVEETRLTYFLPGEAIPLEDRANLLGFDTFDDQTLARHPRVRRVLTAGFSHRKTYGVLHWSDGRDLNLLDGLVSGGTVRDEDFDEAVFAQLETIGCLNCGAELRTLGVDTGQALLARTRTERLRTHDLKRRCPLCGERLNALIVEFLGADEEP